MQVEIEEKFEDWRGKEAISGKHGGIKAAFIACVVETMENMVFLAYSTNFMMYFTKSMNYSSPKAATMVTNFIGTSFLLTIFGGFVADSFLTRFAAFVLFGFIELLGLVLLTLQAHITKLQPQGGKKPSTLQSTVLFTGLYAIAIGVGGVKGSLPAHGGDQIGTRNQRLISGFFNWYFFSVCLGGFLAVTFMVWIEENKGWSTSFNISTAVLASAIFIFVVGCPMYRFKRPAGSPLTRIVNVFVSATRNRNRFVTDAEVTQNHNSTDKSIHHNKFKFLNKAKLNNKISATQVEETRTFLALLPIFASTIVMNCCVAQMGTFSVQQGMVTNRKLSRSFEIPVASLNAIPLLCMLSSLALFELFGKRILSNSERSSSFNLKRIGSGLALTSISMAVAAIVEVKRKHEAVHNNIEISVFWLELQFVLLSFSDMLTVGGMLEFFFRESPASMRSMSTALGWCSTAMGFFLSSVLVEVVNGITGWLRDDLNESRLELFYVVLCVLNTLNLFNYIFWAKRY
ncbi:Proton-dependent oligopeptide transporter family [Arabidopsis suecica]|uniref:Proton-dependent oligopeptide transporter family n=1 Tax=Arabidopsis suecica TaxID=45249 RepID=A0A8T2B9W5_ARASU|nr:Proton-dependent oligopeptide transporter family [Arabidopsis suecica]